MERLREPTRAGPRSRASVWTPAEGLAWIAALIFTLSAFMGWYSGVVDGLRVSALGWDTGLPGKLVVVVGVATLVVLVLRAAGVALPPAVPVGMVIAALGTAGTILVLIRLIDVPDDYPGLGRSLGIWVSLASALLLIVAGLLKASDDA
jgi:hypothetical protein